MSAAPQPRQQDVACAALAELDSEFEPVGCLGHGAFGSVFVADKKPSGRRVVLKMFSLNPLDDAAADDAYQAFQRETQAVKKLSTKNSNGDDNRDLGIIFFEDSFFYDRVCATIVMKYVDGGTLSDEIIAKANTEDGHPYTERRIAWYALQLAEALAFAHERGVAHHDVKSSNVMIDRRRGDGKLVLVDFGSAVAPGEESVAFTKHYASPELLDAFARDDFTGLQADKIDAFGLGCILFELVSCGKLMDVLDQPLADVLQNQGIDAALNLSCVRLPWLPVDAPAGVVGYSDALKNLIKTLLEPQPNSRWRPGELQKPLRTDCRSPLLCSTLSAAQPPVPGAPLTIDNIQLGMFVQRGHNWQLDDDADGGCGKIGVVVKLDADAVYTEVAWPTLDEPCCYRIGAADKFELQVAPTPLPDFFGGTNEMRWTGLVQTDDDASQYSIGQTVNDNCMVVMLLVDQKHIMVTPTQPILVPTQRIDPPQSIVTTVGRREPQGIPKAWEPDLGLLVEVRDLQEKEGIIELLYSLDGGMDIQKVEVESIHRVQSTALWEKFDLATEKIAHQNWGLANQQRLFIGTGSDCPESLVRSQADNANSGGFLPRRGFPHTYQFYKGASYADRQSYKPTADLRLLVLCRVALGKVKVNSSGGRTINQSHTYYHSERTHCRMRVGRSYQFYSVQDLVQAYPEYIVTYRLTDSGTTRRGVTAMRPPGISMRSSPSSMRSSPSSRPSPATTCGSATCRQTSGMATSAISSQSNRENAPPSCTAGSVTGTPTKLCVVCLTNPVNRVLVPCGHAILCQICSTEQGLAKLRRKCPECRHEIQMAQTIFGRVVD